MVSYKLVTVETMYSILTNSTVLLIRALACAVDNLIMVSSVRAVTGWVYTMITYTRVTVINVVTTCRGFSDTHGNAGAQSDTH